MTDLSLRSRPVTASTSIRDYTDGRNSTEATTSGTDSGKNVEDGDMEESVSDNSSGDGRRQKSLLLFLQGQSNDNSQEQQQTQNNAVLKGKNKNKSASGKANGNTRPVANGKGQKLSRANMEKHDRQWALFISHNGPNAENDQPIENERQGRKERTNSSEETSDSQDNHSKSSVGRRRRKKPKKKRRVSLPGVSSSLCRSFPLPGPAQIESYLKAYDSVDLNTRSNSPQNSSSADNISME